MIPCHAEDVLFNTVHDDVTEYMFARILCTHVRVADRYTGVVSGLGRTCSMCVGFAGTRAWTRGVWGVA